MKTRRFRAETLAGLGVVAILMGEPRQAVYWFGAANTALTTIGAQFWPVDRAMYDRYLVMAQTQIDTPASDQAWAEGQALMEEQATVDALKWAQQISQSEMQLRSN